MSVVSFGYKFGIPLDADLVFDCRFLPNPHYLETLRPLPGTDPRVRYFVLARPESAQFLEHVFDFTDYLMPQFVGEGKTHLTVGIGCTGGRHRSVMIADELAGRLRQSGFEAQAVHRDVRQASLDRKRT